MYCLSKKVKCFLLTAFECKSFIQTTQQYCFLFHQTSSVQDHYSGKRTRWPRLQYCGGIWQSPWRFTHLCEDSICKGKSIFVQLIHLLVHSRQFLKIRPEFETKGLQTVFLHSFSCPVQVLFKKILQVLKLQEDSKFPNACDSIWQNLFQL